MDLGLFGIGLHQILFILVVALIIFGPDKLPGIARQAGRYVNEFRRLTQEARGELQSLTKELDLREDLKNVKDDLLEIRNDLTSTTRELTKEFQEVKKEVDIQALTSGQPLEQSSYSVEPLTPIDPELVLPSGESPAVIEPVSQPATDDFGVGLPTEEADKRAAVIQDAIDSNPAVGQEPVAASTFVNPLEPTLGPAEVAALSNSNGFSNGNGYHPRSNGNHDSLGVSTDYLQHQLQELKEQTQNDRREYTERLTALERQFLDRLDRLEQTLADRYQPTPQG